jgi:hypothetical protein
MQLEINLDLPPKETKKDPTNNTCHKFIVDNFLVDHRKNVYIYQLKIAKQLFALIPDFGFWKWMSNETEKVYTLKDFLKPEKIKWLKIKNKKRKLDIRPTKEYDVSDDFFCEVEPKPAKPKTKLDFITYEPEKD